MSRGKRRPFLVGGIRFVFAVLLIAAIARSGSADKTPREDIDETLRLPRYELVSVKAEDSVKLEFEAKKLVILVGSKSGIGGTTIRLLDGDWPEVVVLRFRYVTGEKFRGLEGFSVLTGKLGVSSFLGNPAKPSLCRLDENGRIDEKNTAGTVDLQIGERRDCIEVTLPMSSLGRDAKSLKFAWVDEYR